LSASFPRANQSHKVTAFRVWHHQDTACRRFANNKVTLLVKRVLIIGKNQKYGSSNTVATSANETPCLLRLVAALCLSHSYFTAALPQVNQAD
jgi:hypothetical protein